MNDRRPEVSVLVVHYRNADATRTCLRAVEGQPGPAREVLVGDNDPSSGFGPQAAREFPSVRYVAFDRNLGYGGALNRLARMAGGHYLLLLNSDVALLPGCLDRLVAAAETHPDAAVVAPRLLHPDGTLQPSARRFPTCVTEFFESFALSALWPRHSVFGRYQYSGRAHDRLLRIDAATGACLLIRRDDFESVGGFDEEFFLYYEEFDLQRRLRARGRRVLLEPAAVAVHGGGASSRLEANDRIHRIRLASRRRWFRKHGNPASRAVLAALQPVAGAIGSIVLALRSRWTSAADAGSATSLRAKYAALLREALPESAVRNSKFGIRHPPLPRLLILVYGFPPARMSGTEMGAAFLAREAVRRGWDARVVVTRRAAGQPARDRSQGFPVRQLTTLPVPILRSIVEIVSASAEIVRQRPDLIHGQALFPCGWLAAVWGRLLGVPSVCYLYGRDVTHPSRLLRRGFGGWTLRRITRPLAATAFAADRTREVHDRPDLAVIHSGFDRGALERTPGRLRDDLGLPAEERVLLFVGRLIPDKGVDLLIEAFEALDPQRRRMELWIAGEGPLRGLLRSRADGRVRFLDGIANERLGPVYRSADLFILPSRVEPFGVVLLEAMSFGLPVVATRVMGVPEIVTDGENGRLVPPGDAAALAGAVAALLDEAPERRRATAARNREKAAGYDWPLRFEAFDRVYRSLANGPLPLRDRPVSLR